MSSPVHPARTKDWPSGQPVVEQLEQLESRLELAGLKPADAIQELDQTDRSPYAEGRGVAIVAIDCLLLEK